MGEDGDRSTEGALTDGGAANDDEGSDGTGCESVTQPLKTNRTNIPKASIILTLIDLKGAFIFLHWVMWDI